jgi:hypothetical protein
VIPVRARISVTALRRVVSLSSAAPIQNAPSPAIKVSPLMGACGTDQNL